MSPLTPVATEPIRLLLSARDPAAARALGELARAATVDGRFSVRLVASEPAATLLRDRGLEVDVCPVGGANRRADAQRIGLFHFVDEVLAVASPDAIVVGLSGPDAGIDEALLLHGRGIPTYAIQDFWGDVNHTFDAYAETYFVLDEFAAAVTEQRSGARAVVTGSIKHDGYSELNPDALRADFRSATGLSDQDQAIGYFGQPLTSVEALQRTVASLATEVAALEREVTLFCRPHPKESREEFRAYTDAVLARGVPCVDAADLPLEGLLCGCDVIASCFSTCGYDQLMLSRHAEKPLGTVLFLLQEEEIVRSFRSYTGLGGIPIAEQGLTLVARSRAQLRAQLRRALDAEVKSALWRRVQQRVPRLGGAARAALDCIAADRRQCPVVTDS